MVSHVDSSRDELNPLRLERRKAFDPEHLERLGRLFKPRSIAVVGGVVAAEVVRQCQKIGFSGELWPVNPRRSQIEGLAAFPTIAALPSAPDATFIAVPREETIEIVGALAQRGAAGAVCYASGFAEVGGAGLVLQERLVEAAGSMALLGPNCYGAINYLDASALWPDPLGGGRVERGVAILTQSGNIALNLTLQRHHLPIAYMVALGNKAVSDVHDCIAVFLRDPRVTAIGVHLEGLSDVAAFIEVAEAALAADIPIVALKAGSSEIGARLAASHTRSLAGSDVLYTALFKRLGVARVNELGEFLETLKLLHVCGTLAGKRVGSLSCSGGEALLVADLGQRYGVNFPELDESTAASLATTLGPLVSISNPLDYQAYIWDDELALIATFRAMMQADVDVCLLVLDIPHRDGVSASGWDLVVNAFLRARGTSGAIGLMTSSMPELMPEHVAGRLIAAGIAPMQGLRETMVAIVAAAAMGAVRKARLGHMPAPTTGPTPALEFTPKSWVALRSGAERILDERAAKGALGAFGLRVPRSEEVVGVDAAIRTAEAIGYPVVLKALSEGLAHKTELGAVRLALSDASAVGQAAASLSLLSERLLVEEMVQGGIAELLIGVTRDSQFGLALTLGAGGTLVELWADSVTLILPCTPHEIEEALRALRCFALLDGYRGQPRADLERITAAVSAVLAYAEANAHGLVELEVNPLIASEHEAVAVDALIRLVTEQPNHAEKPIDVD